MRKSITSLNANQITLKIVYIFALHAVLILYLLTVVLCGLKLHNAFCKLMDMSHKFEITFEKCRCVLKMSLHISKTKRDRKDGITKFEKANPKHIYLKITFSGVCIKIA